MRKQKDEELDQYKKDIERSKRFENQKGTGQAIPQEKIVVKRKAPGAAVGTGGAGGPI